MKVLFNKNLLAAFLGTCALLPSVSGRALRTVALGSRDLAEIPSDQDLIGNFQGPRTQSCRDSRVVTLDEPVTTKKLTIEVTQYYRWPSMRVGVNGETAAIANVTATSTNGNPTCGPSLAALPAEHGCSSTCCSSLGWCGESQATGDVLVIELEEETLVENLVVQGIYGGPQWGTVTYFNLYAEQAKELPELCEVTEPTPQMALQFDNNLEHFIAWCQETCGKSMDECATMGMNNGIDPCDVDMPSTEMTEYFENNLEYALAWCQDNCRYGITLDECNDWGMGFWSEP